MGWLYMSRHNMGGHATPSAYLADQFTYSRTNDDGTTQGLRVLESACVLERVRSQTVCGSGWLSR